jgi:hypothetical protein
LGHTEIRRRLGNATRLGDRHEQTPVHEVHHIQ